MCLRRKLPAMPGDPAAQGLDRRRGCPRCGCRGERGGAPLADDLRAYFEPRLGHDLGGVRVHTGGAADRGAQAVQARAYTLGRDIVLLPSVGAVFHAEAFVF